MDAPKCRLCGERHWGTCNSFLMDPVVVSVDELVANVAVNTVVNKESRHGRYADKEKRRGYMKEYMRKRRLEKRGVYEQV